MSANLASLAENVARSLSYSEANSEGAFITTAVTYANGTAVIVRITEDRGSYQVTDDGYGALTAEMMGALKSFAKVAGNVAARHGVGFDRRAISILITDRDALASAVSAVANASANAVERTVFALERARIRQSKELFESRLREAFGDLAHFGVSFRGATREWEFDAVVQRPHAPLAVFEFVSPAVGSVAHANMKIGDIRHRADPPDVVAALSDYEGTEPALRLILSNAGSKVIPVDTGVTGYRSAA